MRSAPPRGPRAMRGVAALLALVVALAGCGDDDAGPAAPSTTSDPGAGATTSTTEGEAPVSCPEGPEPRGEALGSPRSFDADGDGGPDEVAVHVAEPATVEVVVTYAAGGRSVLEIADENVATFADIRVAATGDVDGDGDEDLWVVLGAGAAVEIATLVLADGCDLVRTELDGRGSSFAFGASVAHLAGIECVDGGGFRTHEGQNAGDSRYEGTTTTWSVGADGRLERVGSEPFEIDLAESGQLRYTTLDCG